jgi:hypothetical protein
VVVAAIEAAIPDAGAVVFAALGVALALHGKRALRPRALNAACVGISLAMNALAAGHGWRDLAIWVMPAAVYALASDTLIGVVRAWVLARIRNQGEVLADDGPTPLALAGSLLLWLLRLVLAPGSTLGGFRRWVVTDCPVAPGVRPGHLAELSEVRQAAEQHLALAAAQRDEAVEQAAGQAQQARAEVVRAQGAEAAMRAELDRVHEDAARLIGEIREAAAARVADLDEARADLRASADRAQAEADTLRGERDRLSGQLRAIAERPRRGAGRPARRTRRADAEPTKRDRLIQIAGERRDLASVPLQEVSKLASALAGELGYSPGTARRELIRHVRELQYGAAGSAAAGQEGSPDA